MPKKTNPYLESVKIEIEWKLTNETARKDVAEMVSELREVLGGWGHPYTLRETTGEK